jgi:hypothetical protein
MASRPTLDVEELERLLTEAHRELWIRTILAMYGTEPQRRAFVDGYNGYPIGAPRVSPQMRVNHSLGKLVSSILNGKR